MQRRRFVLNATAALATPLATPSIVRAQPAQAGRLMSAKASFRLATLARDLEQPWSIAFLPDGRLLITERPGRLRVFANGKLERTPLGGVPKVYASGQAGLLDICLHPGFATNRLLYLSYVADGPGGAVTTVARAELGVGGLRGVTPLFEALPRRSGSLNLGSRIVFDRAGLNFVADMCVELLDLGLLH